MARKEAKAKINARMNAIAELALSHGGTLIKDNRSEYPTDPMIWSIEFAFNTPSGYYRFTVNDECVTTQFGTSEGYAAAIGGNSYSGKYNHHWSKPLPPTEEIVDELRRSLKRILSAEPTPEQLRAILTAEVERKIRDMVWREAFHDFQKQEAIRKSEESKKLAASSIDVPA